MAIDRFLLAYLSRFKARTLLAKLMKNLGRPAIAPGLNRFRAFPMQSIGHQILRRIPEIALVMNDKQPTFPIPFQPHHFAKDPAGSRGAIAQGGGMLSECLWMGSAQLVGNGVHPTPFALRNTDLRS